MANDVTKQGKKLFWVVAAVLVVLVLLVSCFAWSIVSVVPKVSRRFISTPLKPGEPVVQGSWAVTPPSTDWRRLTAAVAAKQPVRKDLWFTHVPSGAMFAVEEVSAGEGRQFLPEKMGDAMLGVYREGTTSLDVQAREPLETCGVPAVLIQFRAQGPKGDFTYLMGVFAAWGRGYEVNAWSTTHDFQALAVEFRKLVTSFCPDDPPFEREWLRDFIERSQSEALRDESAKFEDVEAREQRRFELYLHGLQRLPPRDLARRSQLLLALTASAGPATCDRVFRFDEAAIEERLRLFPADDIRDWYRIVRRAQEVSLAGTTPPNATSEASGDEALRRIAGDERFRDAWRVLSVSPDELEEGELCAGVRDVYTHAATLDGDERDALLRGIVRR